MRTWMQAFPPSGPDQAYQKRFAPLGLLDPVSPYADCPPDLAGALTAGADAAKQQMETLLRAGNLAPVINGWMISFHIFDYNLDHLGLGTVDNPEWKMADRTASYLARALAARGGLWGNHGYEAAYPMTYTDADGDQLDGHNRYAITFEEDRPSAPSGPSPCTICPTSTWSPTQSAATPSATVHLACAATPTARLPS